MDSQKKTGLKSIFTQSRKNARGRKEKQLLYFAAQYSLGETLRLRVFAWVHWLVSE